MAERLGEVRRRTAETDIHLRLVLDGQGLCRAETGVPFFDHMLQHVALHALYDLEVSCQGDTAVDAHHTVEDVGIAFGWALAEAVGDKAGLTRYGERTVPMDEALVQVVLDLSGRAYLACDLTLPSPRVGTMDSECAFEFLAALCRHAGLTLHVRQLAGRNTHHLLEATFKALGRALGQATSIDARRLAVPSTKGIL